MTVPLCFDANMAPSPTHSFLVSQLTPAAALGKEVKMLLDLGMLRRCLDLARLTLNDE